MKITKVVLACRGEDESKFHVTFENKFVVTDMTYHRTPSGDEMIYHPSFEIIDRDFKNQLASYFQAELKKSKV